jgi:hypothetical protein
MLDGEKNVSSGCGAGVVAAGIQNRPDLLLLF